jgi:hypothetical protein
MSLSGNCPLNTNAPVLADRPRLTAVNGDCRVDRAYLRERKLKPRFLMFHCCGSGSTMRPAGEMRRSGEMSRSARLARRSGAAAERLRKRNWQPHRATRRIRAVTSSVWVTLPGLARRGFVWSRQRKPTRVRGGRAKLFWSITPRGQSVVTESLKATGRFGGAAGCRWFW